MRHAFRPGKRVRKSRGFITFEWILLISLLVIGIIGGLAAVRNSLLSELDDLQGAIEAINVSPQGIGDSDDPSNSQAAVDSELWWNGEPQ